MYGPLDGFGRLLIGFGAALVSLGMLLVISQRFPAFRIGRLPGDITVGRGNFRLYLPLTTSLLLSLMISLVILLVSRRSG